MKKVNDRVNYLKTTKASAALSIIEEQEETERTTESVALQNQTKISMMDRLNQKVIRL